MQFVGGHLPPVIGVGLSVGGLCGAKGHGQGYGRGWSYGERVYQYDLVLGDSIVNFAKWVWPMEAGLVLTSGSGGLEMEHGDGKKESAGLGVLPMLWWSLGGNLGFRAPLKMFKAWIGLPQNQVPTISSFNQLFLREGLVVGTTPIAPYRWGLHGRLLEWISYRVPRVESM
ncbi:hypothetical protein NE237_010931 [Protea cynaroides]|uniref:Uncharacterized protein n=1 Tax=Protea cynaroides TaxID=273540 RepID=A0A9Q0L1K1_9MAGN|nr:hypothetical protein NE237_010931 [Protea cynaroides]